MNKPSYPSEIIKLMKQTSYRPSRLKEISRRLGISKEERSVIKVLLRRMIRDGKISRRTLLLLNFQFILAGK